MIHNIGLLSVTLTEEKTTTMHKVMFHSHLSHLKFQKLNVQNYVSSLVLQYSPIFFKSNSVLFKSPISRYSFGANFHLVIFAIDTESIFTLGIENM